MRNRMAGLAVLVAVLASFTPLSAAEHFGVPVYGGARLDNEETSFLQKNAAPDGYVYRSADKAEKVAAFYSKQPGVLSLGSDEHGGRFIKEGGGFTVYVTVESPWQPARGGEVNQDTRIVIVKE
jgi:hypothetical protein